MRRVGVVAAAAAAGVLMLAGPASAHVTVNPKDAVQGSYARVAFRVPNESDDATTTKLEVHMPENAPLSSVSTMPVPGWTVATTKRKLDKPIDNHGQQISEVVSVITWTATSGNEIKPGQFQEFPVSMGRLPSDINQMMFKALQTYSDGTIVRWIEDPAGGSAVEHPAPVLKLLPAANGSASPSAAAVTVPVSSKKDTDWFGIAGLAAGVIALIVAGLALARSRSNK